MGYNHKGLFYSGFTPRNAEIFKTDGKIHGLQYIKLATETTHPQLAGSKSHFEKCNTVNPINADNIDAALPDDVMNSIADKVVERLANTTLHSEAGGYDLCRSEVNSASANPNRYQTSFGQGNINQ